MIFLAIFCDLMLYAVNALVLVSSICFNACLCVWCALHHLVFLAYRLVVAVGGGLGVVFCGGFE